MVHEAHEVLLAAEMSDLMGTPSVDWQCATVLLAERIEPLSAAEAECAFPERFAAPDGELEALR